jgi:hypothetical protein
MANCQEMSGGQRKRAEISIYIKAPPHHMLTGIMEQAGPSLVTQGWISDKPCLVTVVRTDIATGWPEQQSNQHYMLQAVPGEAIPILKEVFLTPWDGAH